MEIKNVFEKIKSVKDIENYLSDIDDGESSWIEFKSVTKPLTSDKFESADMRVVLAKEICAFANTDGGILIVGVDKRKESGLVLINEEANLEEWAERNLTDILDPKLHGYSIRSLDSSDDNSPIAIYIPKSELSPHRVRSNYNKVSGSKREYVGEYFVRRGTKSEKLDENLIRAMYLSDGRLPNFKLTPIIKYAFIKPEANSAIKVGIKVSSDKYKFIKDYYLNCRLLLVDEYFNTLLSEDINIFFGKNPPIYPSADEYILDDFTIEVEEPRSNDSEEYSFSVCTPLTPIWGSQKVSIDAFKRIKYIIINIRYACEGMQLVDETFYFVVFQTTCYTPIGGIDFIESADYCNVYVDERCLSQDKIPSGFKHSEEYIEREYDIAVRNLVEKMPIPKK